MVVTKFFVAKMSLLLSYQIAVTKMVVTKLVVTKMSLLLSYQNGRYQIAVTKMVVTKIVVTKMVVTNSPLPKIRPSNFQHEWNESRRLKISRAKSRTLEKSKLYAETF